MQLEIFNKTDYKVDETLLKKVLEIAKNYEKKDNIMFNIILVDNEEIHKINKEYRNIDRPTDVISFALEDDKTFPNMGLSILGDIYISVDKVKEQANSYGHSEVRELCFLAVHGFLHLLGYDHMKESDEKIMFHHQEEILNEAGITR